MKLRMFLAVLLLYPAAGSVSTMQSGGCEADGNVRFICGVVSPEDLVAVPRSDWVIASGYTAGGVHLINTRDTPPPRCFRRPIRGNA